MSDVIKLTPCTTFMEISDRVHWMLGQGQTLDIDYTCDTIYDTETQKDVDEWWIRDPKIRTMFMLRWS